MLRRVATRGLILVLMWLKVLAVKPAPASGTFTLGADREVLFLVPPIAN